VTRFEEVHVSHPVGHELRPVADRFQITSIPHIETVVSAGEDMRFDRDFGGAVFVEQAEDDRGGALVIIRYDQEGRRGIGGDSGG
jgi:hypothetical protein